MPNFDQFWLVSMKELWYFSSIYIVVAVFQIANYVDYLSVVSPSNIFSSTSLKYQIGKYLFQEKKKAVGFRKKRTHI